MTPQIVIARLLRGVDFQDNYERAKQEISAMGVW